jgi:glyoxylase-like metal-dependent hydrolase (beta-lactamase superfamily II)
MRWLLDNVFCGDSLFHPSIGTARCDFPGGDASQLYASAQKLLKMPEPVRIYMGHDYLSYERDTPVPWLSVREHKEQNPWVGQAVSEQDFVAKRQERDMTLKEPKLLHESFQVNVRAGRMAGGKRTLHFPANVGGGEEW